ncbi:hypothetical protein GPA19_24790 [Azoarcus indigens]|uniref:Uncharacterized protein n=1 Tax=Azoarcus indigens TaxID=29545 RepID=A0A4V3BK60_9RHOO|nr:hypothetical protein [Azoarcus indigens]NMG68151.1 hypothetical protein [Azoarcus indigens]TDN41602.1 hypothetical protein C7389_1642 [Azoarcus indigens]
MSIYIPILQEYVGNVRIDLEELIDRAGCLVLTLARTDGRRIHLKFDSYMAYRKLDEGDALLTLSAMRKTGGLSKCFYRVDDSDFLIWFNAERCGPASGQPLGHYSVAAINDVVDVLSLDPPTVEMA